MRPSSKCRRATDLRYPFVLLDVGQTLVGPAESFGAVYGRVFRELGVDVSDHVFERSLRQTMAAIEAEVPRGADRYAHYPGGEDAFWLRFSRATLERVSRRAPDDDFAVRALVLLRKAFGKRDAWRIFPDVVPALEALRADGVRLAVVSNWDSRLPAVLRLLELDGYFESLSVSHLVGVEKPDPGIFRHALEQLGARPETALHVGDLPEIDLAGAHAAGVDGLLVDRRGVLDPALAAVRTLELLPGFARDGLPRPR